ncbi:MAG: SIS domain-containing protein [Candidatus Gastranaerophilales bacterium]|nr:SIS domain-containing protein [Candidatus Gastranaerophilales bacterium]
MRDFIKNYISTSIDVKTKIMNDDAMVSEVEKIVNQVIKAYQNKKKIITAGNGGSAADAQHIACEFVSKFNLDRHPLRAISLTVNSSILTAISNDYHFEKLFSRQLEAIADNGDIFFAISTSGNSQNIINAINKAKELGVVVVGLTGQKPSKIDGICDYLLKAPSFEVSKIQEAHIMLGHIICDLVEKKLFE